jgi:hypothetical protein
MNKMALITCPECSKSISDQARSCGYCGFPINPIWPEIKNFATYEGWKFAANVYTVGGIVMILIGLFGVGGLFGERDYVGTLGFITAIICFLVARWIKKNKIG